MITDRYTYSLAWDNMSQVVHPLEEGVSFPWVKEGNMAYFRMEMNGVLVFKEVFGIVAGTSWKTEFTLTIYREGIEFFVGKFRKYDCEFDEDRCLFKVTPVVYDKYYDFLTIKDKEINILNSGLRRRSVKTTDINQVEKYIYQEYSTPGIIYSTLPPPPTTPIVYNYYLAVKIEDYLTGGQRVRHIIYWREYQLLSPALPAPSPSEGWDSGTIQLDGTIKYIRPYLNITASSTNLYIANQISATHVQYEIELFGSYADGTPYDRVLLLNSVLGVFLTGTNLTLKSDILINSMNYVIDNSPVLSYPLFQYNPLRYLCIMQKSDAKKKSNNATIGMISFNKMMNILAEMLQFEWWIDGTDFRIEHTSWGNVSYGLDLTSAFYLDFIKTKNSYSYNVEMPKKEVWEFMEAENTDFLGKPLEYYHIDPEANIISHNIGDVTTDINFIKYNPDAISDNGWVIIQTYWNNIDGYFVGYEEGKLSKTQIYNGHLSIANIQHYYWRDNRPLPEGVMNGSTTALDQKKVKIQEGISIPYTASFNPNKLIKTELGWGKVIEAAHNINSEQINMILAHD